MANADNQHSHRDKVPQGGQRQGGISHEVAEKAQREHDPEAGVPNGPQDSEPVSVPARQLPREDEDEDESGSAGDDGGQAAASTGARLTADQAIAPEGSVGRRSGTGQAKTHRSFDESEGRQLLGRAVDPDGELPDPHVGDSYQSGVGIRASRDR